MIIKIGVSISFNDSNSSSLQSAEFMSACEATNFPAFTLPNLQLYLLYNATYIAPFIRSLPFRACLDYFFTLFLGANHFEHQSLMPYSLSRQSLKVLHTLKIQELPCMNIHYKSYLGFNHIAIFTLFLLSSLHILFSGILWCEALGITCNSVCVLCLLLNIRSIFY